MTAHDSPEVYIRVRYVLGDSWQARGDIAGEQARIAHLLTQRFARRAVHVDAEAGGFERRQPLGEVRRR